MKIGKFLSLAIIFSTGLSLAEDVHGFRKLFDTMEGPTDGKVRYRERVIAAWPGLQDESALDELLGIVLKPGVNKDFPSASRVLDAMQFSKDVIVGKLLERSKNIDSYETGLNRFFHVISYYGEDPRVMPFLVSYIDDKRPMGRREPIPGEEYHSISARVCDCSAAIIREILHKRGLLGYGEPGMGQPGGEFTRAEADRQLGLLKEVLRRNGLMEAARPGGRRNGIGDEGKVSVPGGNRPGDTPITPDKDTAATPLPIAAIAGASLLVLAAAAWLVVRRLSRGNG